ncbi:DNA-binding NarL/FixJ family response regulator [Agromyces cerinus]|nr:DNA-binding NarL/FixJ family response regulator [Agromyces cerinus]
MVDVTVRVLIADDQELVRAGLRVLLDTQPDIEVIAEAADGAEAIALARRLRPDVCLLDIRMPGTDGLEATRAIAGPDVAEPIPVVVITTFDLDEYVYAALRAGARGFLLKDAGPAMLAEAVHAAARGDALIAPNVTVRLLEAFAEANPVDTRDDAHGAPLLEPLTAREREVLAAVARGLGNTEIAGELHISLSTVKTHIASLMTKLGARNRVELAIWALGEGRGRRD